jgi:signal transduction histidine kinase
MWLVYTLSVIAIFHITALIVFALMFITMKIGGLSWHPDNLLLGPLMLLIASAIVGTLISLIAGRKQLVKIQQINELLKEIARGNFDIRLNETSRTQEIQEVIENFNSMVGELGKIETLKTDFVTNVSHEFKTPLSAIEGYAVLLQDDSLSNEERREYTSTIIESSKQLSGLAGNILKLSKLENQEIFMNRESFRLDEQIREVILLIENKWSQKQIIMNIELPQCQYYGDKTLLMQVWINLIDNAIKFSKFKGAIDIKLSSKDEMVKFEIKDDGVGINNQETSRIFDKFYQGEQARSTKGNGLGLALVKRIVDISEGCITVEGKVGKGSTFAIFLPKKQ